MLRHKTHKVIIGNIAVGGDAPIVVQSMTDTDTANIDATVEQVIQLAKAGSEIVRITVDNKSSAAAVPYIKEKVKQKGYDVPIVGCFHYNGHTLLKEVPDCATALDKYRINPGNVGAGTKRDKHFEEIVEIAIKNNKPVRIGVNWGSLDQDLLAKKLDEAVKNNISNDDVIKNVIVESALNSAALAEKIGLLSNMIIISAKVSNIMLLKEVYVELAKKCNYALHLGLTEAGMGMKGIVSTAAGLTTLLQLGIGDTIRASITPQPNEPRINEVLLCKELLQSLGMRSFSPSITSCPGCGRTTSDEFKKLTLDVNQFITTTIQENNKKYPGVESLKIAVMGCIVNGPGESKHADIGISLPGKGENPIAVVFIDGEKKHTLRGENIAIDFKNILLEYIENRFRN